MENELKIIEEIIAGNTKQFRILVEKYQNPVYKVILKITGNNEDALEITQDVFVKVFESLNQYKPEYKFFSWIYRISINRALLFEKRKKKFISTEGFKEKLKIMPFEAVDLEERDKLLNNYIQGLKDYYKTVVLLKYYSDLSYSEISEVLGIPEKTVKSRLYDARVILKDKLLENKYFKNEYLT